MPIEIAAGEKIFLPYSPLRISPDGKYVAYVVRDERCVNAGLPMNLAMTFSRSGVNWVSSYATAVYVTDVQTGKTTDITTKGSNWAPAWSSHGDRLAFVSDRDGLARLWVWQTTGKIHRISPIPVLSTTADAGPAWADSDRTIIVETLPTGLTFAHENAVVANAGHRDQRFLPASSASVFDHVRESTGPSQKTRDLEGYLKLSARPQLDLSLVDVRTGQVRVLRKRFEGFLQGLDATGRDLLFISKTGANPKNFDVPLIDISVVDVRSTNQVFHVAGVSGSFEPRVFWSPSGSKFAYFTWNVEAHAMRLFVADVVHRSVSAAMFEAAGPQAGIGIPLEPSAAWLANGRAIVVAAQNHLWIVDIAANSVRTLESFGAQSAILTARNGSQVWQPNGPRNLYLRTWDPQSNHQRIDEIDVLTGTARTIRSGAFQYSDAIYGGKFDASPIGSSTAVFVAWDARTPPEVWTTKNGFRSIHRLTHLNPELDGYVLGKQEIVTWETTDAHLLKGTLLLPAEYIRGRRYPTIVWQYPAFSGPALLDAYGALESSHTENWQILATRGYAIFFPEYPVNTADDIARLTETALIPALDKLVAIGISDPNRFGITGESFGGYVTMQTITLTQRFRAAVVTVGLDNVFTTATLFLPSGSAPRLASWERTVGGTPWSNAAGYSAASPFFRLDRVRTPTLIVASRGEWTDTVPQYFTDGSFVGLRALNQTDVEYALYSGGHGPFAFSYADRVDFWYRIVHWFNTYLVDQRDRH